MLQENADYYILFESIYFTYLAYELPHIQGPAFASAPAAYHRDCGNRRVLLGPLEIKTQISLTLFFIKKIA